MRTANPTLKPFEQPQSWEQLDAAARAGGAAPVAGARSSTMTVSGAATATMILVGITMASAVFGWSLVESRPQLLHPLWITGGLASLAIGFALRAAPRLSAYLSVVYAVLEGAFLGGLSFLFERFIAPGVVIQALLLTFGILLALLLAYKVGLVRIGSTAKRCIYAATGGVMFLYLAVFVLHLLGVGNIPFIHELFALQKAGWIGIGFSVFVVVLASLNLVLDFQMIEEGAQAGLPRYMEWYAGFALLTTLVWLYIELLRLLAKLRSSD